MNDYVKTGMIVDIYGSSFVDGPGIRTTIFLKGCPLRCLWCCNPEMQNSFPERNRLFPKKGRSEVFGKRMSVDEVVEVVKKDIPFYRASGGGVTIAGGEPTYQSLFTLQLIRRCKELGIHTALDTCGYANGMGERVLEEADLLLYDLKNMDRDEHKRNTGVWNDIVVENLSRMVKLKRDIIIRIPLIPGYTDTRKNIKAIAGFLSTLGRGSIRGVELVPYHKGGMIKYEMIGRDYALEKSLERQSDEYLQEVIEILEKMLGKTVSLV